MAEDKNETHYFLDGNPEELERLRLGHQVIRDFMGKLVFAPLDFSVEGLRVLDSATADGMWLQDLRDHIPTSSRNTDTFIGTDITSKYFPSTNPEGITLLEQSITRPWPREWTASFDLVHQRMALPAAGTQVVEKTLEAFYDLIKPGGWIQLVEPDHSISKGPAMADFYRLLGDTFTFMGTSTAYGPRLMELLGRLGFEELEEKIFDILIGKLNTSEEMEIKSIRMMELVIKGLAEVASTIPTSFSSEELQQLRTRVKEELVASGGVFRLYCVYGRKPLATKADIVL